MKIDAKEKGTVKDTEKNGNAKFSDGVVLRPMTAEDVGIVNEFFDAMGPESRAMFNRADYQRKWALRFCGQPDAKPVRRYWLAEYDGKMAGFVFLYDWNTTIPGLGIGVRDDLKGMHLGDLLMEHASQAARSAGKGGIRLTTHVANLGGQMLYEKKGFHCMGQARDPLEVFYLLWFEDGSV